MKIQNYQKAFHPQLEAIFFESSSKKDFTSAEEKQKFLQKYLGSYLERFPQWVWIALEGDKVLGYVLGSPVTDSSFYREQPHLPAFEEYFTRFPAHLHINCHHEGRGKGIGSQLVHIFVEALMRDHVKGLHIMTGSDSENRNFYRKLGFDFEVVKNNICFMGKSFE